MSGGGLTGPPETVDELDRGRAAFGRRAWADAHAALTAADQESGLAPADIESLAIATRLLGCEDEAAATWERAYRNNTNRADHAAAARCACRLAFDFFNRGEVARGAGWLARARRHLDQVGQECAEHGYVALPVAIEQVYAGDWAGALANAETALAVGERCRDIDLVAFARCVIGRTLIRQGKVADGMALLDEVMVAVIADDVSPSLAGDLYCSVIEGCQDAYDLRRAREWTAALAA
ncbi:MAG: hypothetical protein LBV34_13910, partial [Nocardiopsaceae bacterium]|nr:hypothetical protein [Nocardiopsaceae bacterium]